MAKKVQASAELERLRQQATDERMKARELEATLEATHAEAQRLEADITSAYEREDEPAAQAAREALAGIVERAEDMRHRAAAATARVATAQRMADVFAHEHAQALLNERIEVADQVTTRLVAAVHETLDLHRQLISERQAQDAIISAGGGSPRFDGAEPSHPWEHALSELAKVVQQHTTLDAPRPRWHGRQHAEERDRVARDLQAQRA